MSSCAVIQNQKNEVLNTIVADPDFEIEGFYLIEYDSDIVFCQKGMFYNEKDNLFYDEEGFKHINGIEV
ncbi:hypothetical protein [Pantoea sp. M_5]|uniref:hypothetical protein n=1 Tax=Pantoea sp. M_5 TaxID=2608038 RepID=UPI001231CD8B|nr:hypothetical protein [Pantoea sp. M_5]KAA6001384.1 hypothetical protein F3I50_03270 [Pantoea sp. M_5]